MCGTHMAATCSSNVSIDIHASLINTTLLQTRQSCPGHGSPELDVFGLKAGSATYGGAALENLASVARAIGL